MGRRTHELGGWALAAGAALLLAACGTARDQSAVDPAGPQAGRIGDLFWLNVWINSGVFALVMIVTLVAIARRRTGVEGPGAGAFGDALALRPTVCPDPDRERRAGIVASVAVGLTVLILAVFLAGDWVVGRHLRALDDAKDPVDITITGRQWWWDVEYREDGADKTFRTANDIHVPVGRAVKVRLQSSDVIHSFWAPNLHGKRDLVPGHPTTITFRADSPGSFTGQCAEYCGHQHAHMRFTIAADEPAAFKAYLDAQRAPAVEPQTDAQRRGRHVFLSSTCVMCHTIRGTIAGARTGPDLTHVASRPTIAGGTLPNTRGNLAGWILDPQHVKPGNRMPSQSLPAGDVHALLDYLESLK
jgi:cytochrome c oxidase subunit 2